MFGKKPRPFRDKVEEKAYTRLDSLSDFAVINWSEQAVNGLHQALDALRRPERADDYALALVEARSAVSMLAGAVRVLEKKQVT